MLRIYQATLLIRCKLKLREPADIPTAIMRGYFLWDGRNLFKPYNYEMYSIDALRPNLHIFEPDPMLMQMADLVIPKSINNQV